jgi:hypothetical protein
MTSYVSPVSTVHDFDSNVVVRVKAPNPMITRDTSSLFFLHPIHFRVRNIQDDQTITNQIEEYLQATQVNELIQFTKNSTQKAYICIQKNSRGYEKEVQLKCYYDKKNDSYVIELRTLRSQLGEIYPINLFLDCQNLLQRIGGEILHSIMPLSINRVNNADYSVPLELLNDLDDCMTAGEIEVTDNAMINDASRLSTSSQTAEVY